jgi:hypothetical protein
VSASVIIEKYKCDDGYCAMPLVCVVCRTATGEVRCALGIR